MSPVRSCPQCGLSLADDAPQGLCPQCLLEQAMQRGRHDHAVTQDHSSGQGRFVPPKPEELAPKFPDLEILELLGHGGMGAVYKARQKMLDRVVALKILPPSAARDPAFAERFTREARALAKLTHPNIVTVYETNCVDGIYYLIMEFVDGVTLRQAMGGERLSPQQALIIVPQICDALQYAHDIGIVHRDIKPENVMLDRQGRVKIADFGLAKLLGQAPVDVTLTAAYQVLGTLHYMAPEQLERPLEVDHRADIFSLGVVFYELLTGELPLGRFKLPSEKSLDARLDAVVLRTLERERERRYQRANEVKTDIQSISASSDSLSQRPTEHPVWQSASVMSLHPGQLAMGAVVVVAGMAFVGTGFAHANDTFLWVGFGTCFAGAAVLGNAWVRRLGKVNQSAYQVDPGRVAMGLVFAAVSAVMFIYGNSVRTKTEFIWIGLGMAWAAAGILRSAWQSAVWGHSDAKPDPNEQALAAVRGPAIGLAICGVLDIVIAVAGIVGMLGFSMLMPVQFQPSAVEEHLGLGPSTTIPIAAVGLSGTGHATDLAFGAIQEAPMAERPVWLGFFIVVLLAVGAIHVLAGTMLVMGSVALARLRSRSVVVAACVMALLPLHVCFVVSLPIAIWTMGVVRRPDVIEAFEKRSASGRY